MCPCHSISALLMKASYGQCWSQPPYGLFLFFIRVCPCHCISASIIITSRGWCWSFFHLFPYHTIVDPGSMPFNSLTTISFHIQSKSYWLLDYILLFLSYIADGQCRVQFYWWMLVYYKQCSGIYELLILYVRHGIIGASHYSKCHSWTPCIPGIHGLRHSVTIPGMEPLSTL